jgi:4-diphosphocytidyl-2-C-methyl-D-erythritol kinase
VSCPAKVNLALRVLGRRRDGYHELDTIFQAIDLRDEIEICPSDTLSLACDDPRLAADDSNLVMRAARLLAERCGIPRPTGALSLRKTIPAEAGLGGGSSDAAGALVLCSRFWGVRLEAGSLEGLGAELGADVPFFLQGGTARGRGRGDRIEALPFAGPFRLLLGCPPFGISTRAVFARVGERLTLPGNGVSFPLVPAHKWPKENDFGFLANDLEGIVFEDWPELERFRDGLREQGARAALLSGSGSTVYGIFTSDEQIERAAGWLRGRFSGWRLVATRAVEDGVRLAAPGGASG